MEVLGLIFLTFMTIGSEFDKVNDKIDILETNLSMMQTFHSKTIDENLAQQKQINDLIIQIERLETKHESDFLNISAAHSSSHARQETMLNSQKDNLELLRIFFLEIEYVFKTKEIINYLTCQHQPFLPSDQS